MQDPATLSNRQLLQLVQEKDNELASRTRTIAQQSDIIRQLEAKIDAKEKAYLKLWQERFAAKSERYIADPDQLRMDFGDTPESADAAAGLAEAVEEADLVSAHRRKKRKKRDESLPDHLPREVIIVEPDESAKICRVHGEKNLLPESMWDVREKLVYIPGSFTVEVRKYVKYACQDEPACGITSAERPTGIVEGDKYDTSVASQILVSKFAYHQPIYRQQDMFAGTGYRMIGSPRRTSKYVDGMQFFITIWDKWCVVGPANSRRIEVYTVGNTTTQNGFLDGHTADALLASNIQAPLTEGTLATVDRYVKEDRDPAIFHARGFEARSRAFTIDPGFDAIDANGATRRCLLKSDFAAESHFSDCRRLKDLP